MLQIWDRSGRLLLRSSNAPLQPISNLTRGFERGEVLGHPVTLYTLAMPGEPYIVQAAQRATIRSDVSAEILEVSRTVVLLSLPLPLWVLYRGIRLESRVRGTGTIRGNRELVYILLRNLIDNAIRYAPPEPEIAAAEGAGKDPPSSIHLALEKFASEYSRDFNYSLSLAQDTIRCNPGFKKTHL